MKSQKILIGWLLSLAVVLCGCSGKPQAEEKPDAAEQAIQSYREILKAAPAIQGEHAELMDAAFDDVQNRELFGEHYDFFAVADLNQDGIPELIASTIVNFRWTTISVFAYADGQAVLLKAPSEESAHGTLEQCSTANGAYSTYLCEENHIHSVWRGTTPVGEEEENHSFLFTGTELKEADCMLGEREKTISFADLEKANTPENWEAMTK